MPLSDQAGLPVRTFGVTKRVALGVYTDGFVHAGNFAYLSLVAVFSFFIVIAAIAGTMGSTAGGMEIVAAFLETIPPTAAAALREPILAAMQARTGPLLWLSAAVGLWSTTSLIETIRDVLHRAYGVQAQRAFWEYRLSSILMILLASVLTLMALSAQFVVIGAEQALAALFPDGEMTPAWLSFSRIIPFLLLFATLYILFRALTPRRYRGRNYPKWPGAVFISGWWLLVVAVLPIFLRYAANYDVTYGSLAGVMVTLIFFYLVGLGLVIGAEINAALADSPRGDKMGGDTMTTEKDREVQ
jgi:membrane protein